MNQTSSQSLEAKVQPRNIEVVSNMNSFRTGQLMDVIERANREADFLLPGRQIILVERNRAYFDEILGKIVPEMCPNHLVSYHNHHLPHYVVHDGKVEEYLNLDQNSPIAGIKARLKHPCSCAEKIPRKAKYFGRVSERHDRHKLMVGDIIGFELVVRNKEDVSAVTKQILSMPFLKLEHFEQHRKANGYTSDHLNMIYENGNAAMKGLELEIQVTGLQSHLDSVYKLEQGHDTGYGTEKLASKRNLDGQLVIVGNSVEIPKDICKVRKTGDLLVAEVPNKIQPYTLVIP